MFSFRALSKEQKQNLLTGAIMLLFGTWMFVQTFLFTGTGRGGDPGPGLVPRVISILVISLSTLLLLTTVLGAIKQSVDRVSKPAETEIKPTPSNVDNKSIFLTFVLFVFYMFVIGPLGYVLSSIIYLFFQMVVLTAKPTRKQLILFAAIAAAVPPLVNHIFVNIFSLMLPRGTLW